MRIKIALIALLAAGCGSVETPAPTPSVIPDASVAGQYNLVLTSTNGHGTTNIYTNLTQHGRTLTGASNTMVCPSNVLSQCAGVQAPAVSVTLSGAVKGEDVNLTISFPSTAGADTVNLVGGAGGTSLGGTYTDSLGDAGTWTGSVAPSLNGTYSGTFNSTSNPLSIAPTMQIILLQDPNYVLAGAATFTNLPCISSLMLTGQAIGGAFSLADAANKAVIFAVPTGNGFTFSYRFEATSASCAGDFGGGVVTNTDPWGY
jgi:hypothetical protein